MLHSRKYNNKIKHLHELCLRLIYSDRKSSKSHNSVSIRHKNIQALTMGMFKVKCKLCPEINSDMFMERTNNQYNLRNSPYLTTTQVQSVFHVTESISYIGPKIWDIVREEFIKNHLTVLKSLSTNCPCRLCKVYLDEVGFINRIYYFYKLFSSKNLFFKSIIIILVTSEYLLLFLS